MDTQRVRRAEGHICVFMKEESVTSLLRWQSYVLTRGQELHEFWNSHLQLRERNVLFILAKGFDPRMCLGLDLLLERRRGRKKMFRSLSSAKARLHRPTFIDHLSKPTSKR